MNKKGAKKRMKDTQKNDSGSKEGFSELMGKTAELWGDMTRQFIDNTEALSKMPGNGKKSIFPGLDTWDTLMDTWNKNGGAGKDYEKMTERLQGASEGMNKLLKAGLNVCVSTQKKWLESADNIHASISDSKLNGPDSGPELFEMFKNIYKQEISKFFAVPQLGLTRFYQEKMMQFVDKFNLFQANLLEFVFLLYLPLGQSFKLLQQNFTDMKDNKVSLENVNDYYKVWVKTLEEKYMELFQSTEYINVLGKALDAFNEFLSAKQAITQDFLKMSGIPVEKDLDELYKDLYVLKKRVVQLEKTIEQLSPSKKSKK